MLTALAAKTHLSRYAGANNDFYERLSLCIERLLKSQNARGTKQLVSFTVYADVNGNAVITLPRKFNILLAGVFLSCATSTLIRGCPLPVHNSWYEYLRGGPGIETGCSIDSFIEMPGRYCTFLDWTTPLLLRFKFEQSEAAGKIIVRGTLGGSQIYSTDGSDWIDGIAVSYSAASDVTTTQLFDLPPNVVIKPVTKGRVSMYTVDANHVETLVAVYDPTETLPAWRRYRVPAATSPVAIMIPASQFYTKADIDAMFGDFSTITVNADVTHLLAPQVPYVEWNQPVIAQAGVAPYVAKFVLDSSYAKKDATFQISIDLAASSNIDIEIYNSTDNTVIQDVDGDGSNARSFYFQARWDGAKWAKVQGYFLP